MSSRQRSVSGDDVGNDLVLDLGDHVLQGQFLLLHALDSEGLASGLDHGVDGGIKNHTIQTTAQAGADFFVVGSGLFHADSYQQRVDELFKQICER